MTSEQPKVRVAVIQDAPVLFDRQASLDKACELIREAGKNNPDLVLLPEAFIPGYPRGLGFGMVVGNRTPDGRALWQRYFDNALEIPGPDIELLGQAAAEAGVFLALGIIERDRSYGRGTLYCTLVYFDPRGRFMGKHRKLKPTGSERLIWGEGDGSTLPVFATDIGRLGGLICWENYMPLARMAMYGQGVQLYLAPTADSRDAWQATIRHVACEGRCFVLGCNQYVSKAMYPEELRGHEELACHPDIICPGGSAVISPLGEVLAGPLYDQPGILYADLDLADTVQGKLDFDVAGHYARPDVFQLRINTRSQDPVLFHGEDSPDWYET